MESRSFLSLIFCLFVLAACGPVLDDGGDYTTHVHNNGSTTYWHNKNVTADTVPDRVKAQAILEEDLAACGYTVRDQNRWAAANDPVSNEQGDVVDHRGVDREDAPLPKTYEVADCMDKKGWVKLRHYYTAPY